MRVSQNFSSVCEPLQLSLILHLSTENVCLALVALRQFTKYTGVIASTINEHFYLLLTRDTLYNGCMYGELLNGELLFVVSGVQRIFNCGHIYKIILLQIKQ